MSFSFFLFYFCVLYMVYVTKHSQNKRDAQKEPQALIIAFHWYQEEEKTDTSIHN